MTLELHTRDVNRHLDVRVRTTVSGVTKRDLVLRCSLRRARAERRECGDDEEDTGGHNRHAGNAPSHAVTRKPTRTP